MRTSADAGRTSPKISPCTVATNVASLAETTYIRVRTTSPTPKPASSSARITIANAARAWAAASPGCSEVPSGPASVVPAIQHESPTATARL